MENENRKGLKNTTAQKRTTNFLTLVPGSPRVVVLCTLTMGRGHGIPLWNDVWLFYTVVRHENTLCRFYGNDPPSECRVVFFLNQWKACQVFIKYACVKRNTQDSCIYGTRKSPMLILIISRSWNMSVVMRVHQYQLFVKVENSCS